MNDEKIKDLITEFTRLRDSCNKSIERLKKRLKCPSKYEINEYKKTRN